MSLDDAVREAVRETDDRATVVGWVVVAALYDEDGEQPLVVLPSDGQQPITTAGLLTLALRDGVGGHA